MGSLLSTPLTAPAKRSKRSLPKCRWLVDARHLRKLQARLPRPWSHELQVFCRPRLPFPPAIFDQRLQRDEQLPCLNCVGGECADNSRHGKVLLSKESAGQFLASFQLLLGGVKLGLAAE